MRMHGAEKLNGEEVMPPEEGQSRTELTADRMVTSENGEHSAIELIGYEQVATGEAYSSEAAISVAPVAARVGAETSMENTCNKVESGNNLQPATFRIIRDSESIQHSTFNKGTFPGAQGNTGEATIRRSSIPTGGHCCHRGLHLLFSSYQLLKHGCHTQQFQ